MDNRTYAICGTLLWIALAAVLCIYGDSFVRTSVAWALFFGAISQFIAQDGNPAITRVAGIMAYIAMGLTAAAMLVHTFW